MSAVALSAAVYGAVTGYRVHAYAARAKADLTGAETRLRSGDVAGSRADLFDAQDSFDRASGLLNSPFVGALSHIPLAHRQIATSEAVISAGQSIVRAGTSAADAAAGAKRSVHLSGGAVDLTSLTRSAGVLQSVVASLEAARTTLEGSSSTWLLGPIGRERAQALDRVATSDDAARRAIAGIDAAPVLLGRGATKRYFLAFDTLAELRGTGGVIGYYAILDARDGKLSLGQTGRPESFLSARLRGRSVPTWFSNAYGRYGALNAWPSLNLSSDFPSMARMMLAAVPASLGPLDGVIQLDPQALSAFLLLTGPVTVGTWPVPLTAENVAEITQHDAYVRFGADNGVRIGFLGDVVRAVFSKLLSSHLDLNGSTLSSLGSIATGGHLQIYSTDAPSQRALASVGVARDLARTNNAGDVLGIVGNNFDGNKIDWYLTRDISYDVSLDPSTNDAYASLTVALHNDAPATGLPDYVIKSLSPQAPNGTNRDLVVVLRTPGDDPLAVTNGGVATEVSRDPEGVLVGYHDVVNVPSHGSMVMRANLATTGAVTGSGRDRTYRLVVLSQPIAHPDQLSIRIRAPAGWSVVGPTIYSGPLNGDQVFEVHLHHGALAWLTDVAVMGPFRVAARLIGRLF